MQTKTEAGSAPLQALLRGAATAITQAWRRLFGGTYRPEKHYMRGPGPKWREKSAAAGATGARPRTDAVRIE
jgi:hypothetical protein